jgi:hypothetical protein
VAASVSEKKAEVMFEFVKLARSGLDPFACQAPMDDDVRAAPASTASNTPEVIMEERERMTVAIEQMARGQHASGRTARWFARADAATMGVAAEAEMLRARVTYMVNGEKCAAGHLAAPFGAVGGVHAWHRIGALISTLARKLFRLPVLRHVPVSCIRIAYTAFSLDCVLVCR